MTDKTMVTDTLAGINGELVRDGKPTIKAGPEADEKPVRNVTGRDLPDCQGKKLLCTCFLGETRGSGACAFCIKPAFYVKY